MHLDAFLLNSEEKSSVACDFEDRFLCGYKLIFPHARAEWSPVRGTSPNDGTSPVADSLGGGGEF